MIDTTKFSQQLRDKTIDLAGKRILLTDFRESEQEKDLSEPPNCGGFGRIRHFRRGTADGWPENPLPINPACAKLGLPMGQQVLEAQAFQSASCNWRCWYCFVPFDLLKADLSKSKFLSAGELIDLYLSESNRPVVIDLTGGQPELTPEWVPWVMEEVYERGIENEVFLWSDDNLSGYYFWEYLDSEMVDLVRCFKNYSKVGCFKGFDAKSFSFNTRADPGLFEQQFDIFARYLDLGIDLYAYATFTSDDVSDLDGKMRDFVDRLQGIHEKLPLRLVPLEIAQYGVVQKRRQVVDVAGAISNQYHAIDAWMGELNARFTKKDRESPINEVLMK